MSSKRTDEQTPPVIARHKAAIRRVEPSLPLKCLLRDRLLSQPSTFFDYGCGHGEDSRHVRNLGIQADGWDPVHQPQSKRQPADVVNLGYVLNVIEDEDERAATLRDAWKLSRRLLTVAARISVPSRGRNDVEFGDGVLTRIGTFQKYFSQAELRTYIQSQLQVEPIPAALGVFYIFRDQQLRETYLAARYRRRSRAPTQLLSERRFEEHRDLLAPFIDWVTEYGRLPAAEEADPFAVVIREFGSLKRAFALVRRVTGRSEWEDIRKQRTDDLLVYLALAKFGKRPRLSQLPTSLQRDVREFFGSYKAACQQADIILYKAGDSEAINEACQRASVGKLLPKALYVHRGALDGLEPLLRIYEGCAQQYVGDVEGANIIKLHRYSGKVSYLAYPRFENDPHPSLLRSFKVSLRELDIQCYDYSSCDNPPVLHRKETFLQDSHPLHAKFTRLTRQEEKRGLLDDGACIGTRDGWKRRLDEAGFELRGHRLVRANPRES